MLDEMDIPFKIFDIEEETEKEDWRETGALDALMMNHKSVAWPILEISYLHNKQLKSVISSLGEALVFIKDSENELRKSVFKFADER